MNIALTSDPSDDAMLAELAALGMRAGRVVVRMMEIEQLAADWAAHELPAPGSVAVADPAYVDAGREADALAAVMAAAGPRVEGLARALDRVSRLVRRTVALRRRMEAGWPRVGSASDSRAAMVRRQVVRSVGDAIRREVDEDGAERLFDELAERLGGPEFEAEVAALPVEEIVRRVCRELGLVVNGVIGDAVPGADAGRADSG